MSYNKNQKYFLFMANQVKIQPWDNDPEEDVVYFKRINTLSHFNTPKNAKKSQREKINILQQLKSSPNDRYKVFSASTTLQNFNKTIRSQYKHRITKLVFHQDPNKKYLCKFQPQNERKKTPLRIFSSHKAFKITHQQFHKSKEELFKSRKRPIYYNMTEMNSPLHTFVKTKCYTQNKQQGKKEKNKIFDKIRKQREKKRQILPVFRELSIQRKVYILQSGIRSQKVFEKQTLLDQKKKIKRKKNMITQICKVEQKYQKQGIYNID